MDKIAISPETIEAAEALLGVSYTAQERGLMGNIGDQVKLALRSRSLDLPNDAPTATRFDPRLPGFRMPDGSGVTLQPRQHEKLPDDDEDIAFAPVTSLGAWIAGGQLTSRRLTEIYLDRIAAFNGRLFCFAAVTADLALAEADAADALSRNGVNLGPLHGIPYGIKDLFDTGGVVTGWGAEPFRHRVPDADAAVVKKLRAAGAVLLGKTAVGELAKGDVWYGGRSRNPWNLDEGSNGSSAGSASATAAGLCGFSIGTETLGSILSPSNRCGATGLRPTFGRVSREGAMALCWSLDKVGPICRSVEDTALVLSAINGGDAGDRFSIDAPFHFDARADVKKLRVGYLPEAFGEGATAVDHEALAAARRLGVEVVETSLPDLPYGALVHILNAEAAASFEQLTLSGQDDALARQDVTSWPNIFRTARFLSAVDHVQLDRLRYRVMLALDALFKEIDVLIGPYATGPMLVASNFTGHPCLHLRAGFSDQATRANASPVAGGHTGASAQAFTVPQGISLWSGLFDEGKALAVGLALERELGVSHRRPHIVA